MDSVPVTFEQENYMKHYYSHKVNLSFELNLNFDSFRHSLVKSVD